ncbi:MAG: aspartate aminotransferase family protein [Geminicoccaceae bacterium]|nr:MAG: aspartate aminotransferase family protein [Geminicoccaceae bacterium]
MPPVTHVFHRQLRTDYPMAVRGDGIWIEDRTGKRYLDASGGAAVSCLGHSHPKVRAAIKSQVDQLAFAHTGFFTTEIMERLADRLIADAPAGMDKVYFVSGGSEAMEAALKMARQYFLEIGQPQRGKFIARRQSYHGNTLGALAVGGNAWRRAQFEPVLIDVEHVTPCYAYREQQAGETDAAFVQRLADELEATILRLGPETVIGFVAEPVVGATMGAVPALPGYFQAIKQVLDRYGCLLILDEVMCGMGRTGTLYASAEDGVVPDLLCIAKGLGAGYQPIGAVLVQKTIADAIRDGSGFFQHGHTYLGHAVACAAALAVQEAIEEEGLLAKVQTLGARLEAGLQERFGNHHHVGDLRGRGLFRGVELVADRSTKAPFDPALKRHAKVKAEAMARGLMVYPMGGTIDGMRGDHVLIAPPFIATEADIDTIVARLGEAVDAALRASAR